MARYYVIKLGDPVPVQVFEAKNVNAARKLIEANTTRPEGDYILTEELNTFTVKMARSIEVTAARQRKRRPKKVAEPVEGFAQ